MIDMISPAAWDSGASGMHIAGRDASNNTSKTRSRKTAWAVFSGGNGPIRVRVVGRELWALRHLIAAGATGCTPIDTPGPRWSHYIWLLRGHGICVETITEAHGGPYAGTHARYVLRTDVKIEEADE